MPSPPLSPTPRRWRPGNTGPEPAFARLLTTYDSSGSEDGRVYPGFRSAPDTPRQRQTSDDAAFSPLHREETDESDEQDISAFLTAPSSPAKAESVSTPLRPPPEIKTTSPSPQRPGQPGSPTPSSHDRGRLSPLPFPVRTAIVAELPRAPAKKSVGVQRETSTKSNLRGPRQRESGRIMIYIRADRYRAPIS